MTDTRARPCVADDERKTGKEPAVFYGSEPDPGNHGQHHRERARCEAVAAYRNYFGQQIVITHPRNDEMLTEPEPLGPGLAYPVRGTLKRLPKGHEIWLLKQDETTGLLWPQGFFNVKHDRERKTWLGKINGTGKKHLRIIAVVAPPTSQDFFRYFQNVGDKQNEFEPLKRIPPECRSVASVQVRIP